MESEIIEVKQDHFLKALEKLSTSVSEEELEHYKRIQYQFSEQKIT